MGAVRGQPKCSPTLLASWGTLYSSRSRTLDKTAATESGVWKGPGGCEGGFSLALMPAVGEEHVLRLREWSQDF